MALSPFCFGRCCSTADITVENAAESRLFHKIHSVSLCLILGRQTTLRALGVQDKIVGFPQSGKIQTIFSEFADKNIRNVGDLKETIIGQINELNPDLIIASKRQEK